MKTLCRSLYAETFQEKVKNCFSKKLALIKTPFYFEFM